MAELPPKHYAPGDGPADRQRRAEERAKEWHTSQRKQRDPRWGFYQTREWKALRAAFIRRFPVCVLCGSKAKHVDHIVPIKVDWSRRLDPANLRPLCHSCHSSVTLKARNQR